MINLFNWVTTLVESFTFYGGGKGGGGSSSSSQPIDFFGKDKRAPYEQLLSQLLLGNGTIGGTSGSSGRASNLPPGVIDAGNGKYYKINTYTTQGMFGMPGTPATSLTPWTPPKDFKATTTPATGGQSITDYIKSTPGYQFRMDQGGEAINRQYAAKGFGQSGGESIALQNYGNQYAGDAYQQLISNLMGPAGSSLIGNSSTSQSTGASPIPGALGTLAGAAFSAPAAAAAAPAFASTAFWLSDRNLKTNIKHIDTVNGIKIYSFNYVWSYIKSIGVMAQDLLRMPQYKDAVHMTNVGYMVDYSKLPI